MTYKSILNSGDGDKKFWVLIDPDKQKPDVAVDFASKCEKAGVDVLLVGTSLTLTNRFNETIKKIKNSVNIPVVIFPASVNQVSPHADGLLFLSLISGRNPQYLIDEHVKAAPLIKSHNILPISVGYMLIDSGELTAVNFMSNTNPLPANKPEIAMAHALAAEFMGMKTVYLESGSGAENSVPNEIIKLVKENLTIPVIVGGGISTPEIAAEKVKAGADILVIGTAFEKNRDINLIKEYRKAIQ
jgi:putative glycerol-1-phosphate prenyltransferase